MFQLFYKKFYLFNRELLLIGNNICVILVQELILKLLILFLSMNQNLLLLNFLNLFSNSLNFFSQLSMELFIKNNQPHQMLIIIGEKIGNKELLKEGEKWKKKLKKIGFVGRKKKQEWRKKDKNKNRELEWLG